MSNTPIPSIEAHFATLSDPRVNRTKKHKLLDIIIIAICAVICGADGWVAVEAFGHAKHDWLATFLQLPYGIPSHDAFGRVFGVLYQIWINRLLIRRRSPLSLILEKELVAFRSGTGIRF